MILRLTKVETYEAIKVYTILGLWWVKALSELGLWWMKALSEKAKII